jgi:DinB superfamily
MFLARPRQYLKYQIYQHLKYQKFMAEATTDWMRSGFTEGDEPQAAIGYLKGHMAVLPAYFQGLPEDKLLYKATQEKWSKKETLGHLVDSGINNLSRFTAIPLTHSPFVVRPYNQVGLVKLNRYQDLPLSHIIGLWESVNRQILFVIEGMSDHQLNLPVYPGYEDGVLRNLGWVFSDYVAHLEHHLKQIYAA